MLWQALSDLHASERPGEDSGKGDKPNDHGIVHLGVPSADATGLGMTRSGRAKGPPRGIGIVERFNRAKLVSVWRSSSAARADRVSTFAGRPLMHSPTSAAVRQRRAAEAPQRPNGAFQ